jgi:hypothetical protein
MGISLLLATASCSSKAPAEAALKAADDSIEAIRADAEVYAPMEFGQLVDSATSAREMYTNGDYKGALAAAQAIPPKTEEVKAQVATTKESMIAEWSQMQTAVPAMVQEISAKVAEMASTKKMPKGMTKEQFAETQAKVESMNQMWTQATGAATGGQVKTAVEHGQHVKAMAEEIMMQLGMTPAPAGA